MPTLPACLPLLAQSNGQAANDFLGLAGDQRFVVLLVFAGLFAAVIIITVVSLAGTITTMHRRSQESQLKQDMLNRGMSAEEIAAVVEASAPKDWIERMARNRNDP